MNRIVDGPLGAVCGTFISKPGFDVLTCSRDQMLLASDLTIYQPIQSGFLIIPQNGTETVSGSVPLDTLVRGNTRVFVWVSAYQTVGGVLYHPETAGFIPPKTGQMRVSNNGANLTFTMTNKSSSTDANIAYVLFRGRY